jgi:hypothetical protein
MISGLIEGGRVNGIMSSGSSERLVIGHNTVLNSQIIGSRTSGSPRPWRSDGPVAHFDSQGPDNPWSGNVWDEDGAYIP